MVLQRFTSECIAILSAEKVGPYPPYWTERLDKHINFESSMVIETADGDAYIRQFFVVFCLDVYRHTPSFYIFYAGEFEIINNVL